MRSWLWNGMLALVALLILGLFGWLIRPVPDLDRDQIDRMIEAGRYDEVEARLLEYLRDAPRDHTARMMLARISLERPEPKPALALEHLPKIRPADRSWEASIVALEGTAHYQQLRFDRAETTWKRALRLDPKAADAGWGLLNLFAIQGRHDEARRLGLRLFEVEPDPHDRVQLLLQLVRHDAHTISPDSIVHQLEPVVAANPDDLHSSLALGMALVRDSRFEEGLSRLSLLSREYPEDADARLAFLEGLAFAGRIEELDAELEQLPPDLADDPRFDAHRAWLASQRGDWSSAVRGYHRAWEAHPLDLTLAHRLLNAIRVAGDRDLLDRIGPRLEAIGPAFEEIGRLYDRIDALPGLGRIPYPLPFTEMAEALTQVGRVEEARGWRTLADRTPSPSRSIGAGGPIGLPEGRSPTVSLPMTGAPGQPGSLTGAR